jgi:hypothetical protein
MPSSTNTSERIITYAAKGDLEYGSSQILKFNPAYNGGNIKEIGGNRGGPIIDICTINTTYQTMPANGVSATLSDNIHYMVGTDITYNDFYNMFYSGGRNLSLNYVAAPFKSETPLQSGPNYYVNFFNRQQVYINKNAAANKKLPSQTADPAWQGGWSYLAAADPRADPSGVQYTPPNFNLYDTVYTDYCDAIITDNSHCILLDSCFLTKMQKFAANLRSLLNVNTCDVQCALTFNEFKAAINNQLYMDPTAPFLPTSDAKGLAPLEVGDLSGQRVMAVVTVNILPLATGAPRLTLVIPYLINFDGCTNIDKPIKLAGSSSEHPWNYPMSSEDLWGA